MSCAFKAVIAMGACWLPSERLRAVTTISSNPAEFVLGLSVATSVLDVSRTASARRSADSNEAIAATAHTRNRFSTNPRFILFSLVSQEPWVAESRLRQPHSFCPILSRPRNYKFGNSAFQSKSDVSKVFFGFYFYITHLYCNGYTIFIF